MIYKKYTKLHDCISTIKVLCTMAAVLYVLYWFLCLLNFTFIKYIALVFDPAVSLVKNFVHLDIPYGNEVIDMVPLVVAAIFQGFYFVFNYFVSVIDRMEEQHKLNVIAERKLEEKLVNENLKEIFKNKTMEYTKFAILLNLDLKPAVDPNMADNSRNFRELAAKEYFRIVTKMREKYATCKAITPGKLFIVYNNFALFDDFFTDLLKEVKEISAINTEKQISTNFIFVIDALKESDKVSNTLDLMEKISTFNYVNKAVATSGFNVRYKLNSKNKYILETMGISRFFEKAPVGAGAAPEVSAPSVDFELFCLKTPKHPKT